MGATLIIRAGDTMKVGDTLPALRLVLRNASGARCSLTGCIATLIVRSPSASQPLYRRQMTVIAGVDGEVEYQWRTKELDAAGPLNIEVEVRNSVGRTTTFPSSGYGTLTVVDDLSEA